MCSLIEAPVTLAGVLIILWEKTLQVSGTFSSTKVIVALDVGGRTSLGVLGFEEQPVTVTASITMKKREKRLLSNIIYLFIKVNMKHIRSLLLDQCKEGKTYFQLKGLGAKKQQFFILCHL